MILLTLRNMHGDVLGYYRIGNFSDLKAVYKDYPNVEDIAAEAESLEDAVNDISNYLSSHHMECEVDPNATEGAVPSDMGANEPPKGYWAHIHGTQFDDGWDQAKHDRGGDKELQEYLRELNAKYDTNPPDSLQKAVKKKESKQPITGQVLSTIPANPDHSFNLHPESLTNGYRYDINGLQKVAEPQDKLTALYRSYKNSPHHPLSTALKYAIHRIENRDAYSKATPEERAAMDKGFLNVHTRGEASTKNGHLQVEDLHKWLRDNSSVIPALLDHQKYVHDSIRKHAPWTISKIDGEEHIPLFRGMNVDRHLRGVDHALSSYADAKYRADAFGQYVHKQMIPLKNLWYSYDIGPGDSSGGAGPEDEYLASPHDIKYVDDNKDTGKIFANRVGDLTDDGNVSKMNLQRWKEGNIGYVSSLDEGKFLSSLEDTADGETANSLRAEALRARKNNLSDEGFDRLMKLSQTTDPTGKKLIEPYMMSHPDLPESHVKKTIQNYDNINMGKLSQRNIPHGKVSLSNPHQMEHISNPQLLAEAVNIHNHKDSVFSVSRSLRKNPHVTTEHLQKILDVVNPGLQQEILNEVADHPAANQEIMNQVFDRTPDKHYLHSKFIEKTSNPQHLDELIHPYMDTLNASSAMHNKNLSEKQLNTAAERLFDSSHPDTEGLVALANHPKVNLYHLRKMVDLQSHTPSPVKPKSVSVSENHPIYQGWKLQEQQKQNDMDQAIKRAFSKDSTSDVPSEPNLKKSLQNIKEVVNMVSDPNISKGIPQSLMEELTESLHLLKMMLGYLILTTQKEKLKDVLSELDREDEESNQPVDLAPTEPADDNIARKTPAYDDPHMDNAFAANNIRQNAGDATPLTPEANPGTPEAIERLAEFATTKKQGETWMYLLHRGTVNYEHESSATDDGNWFETSEETEWVPEYMEGERDQKGVNPVVSCWIDEGRILKVFGAQENNGTWGELGKNPHAHEYRVVVGPGKYKIHSELKA